MVAPAYVVMGGVGMKPAIEHASTPGLTARRRNSVNSDPEPLCGRELDLTRINGEPGGTPVCDAVKTMLQGARCWAEMCERCGSNCQGSVWAHMTLMMQRLCCAAWVLQWGRMCADAAVEEGKCTCAMCMIAVCIGMAAMAERVLGRGCRRLTVCDRGYMRVILATMMGPVAALDGGANVAHSMQLLTAGGAIGLLSSMWSPEDGIDVSEIPVCGEVDADGDLVEAEGEEDMMSMESSDGDDVYMSSDDDECEGEDVMPDHMSACKTRLRSTDGNWAGDSFGTRGRSTGMIIFADNVRRLPLGRDIKYQTEFWKRLAVRGADFVGLADHGLEIVTSVPKGQYSKFATSGKTLRMAEKWGRYGMQWIVSVGLKGARGSELSSCYEGGTLLAPSAQWRGAAQDHIVDSRGWGRFSGTVVKGNKGWKSQIIILMVYVPTPRGATWERQETMLRQLRGVQKGIEANPRAQCYRDIYEAVKKYRHSKVMRTAFVVMGDFNEEYSDGANVTSLFSGIVAFADVM